jgi:hypothetical protein
MNINHDWSQRVSACSQGIDCRSETTKERNEVNFALLEKGPSVLNVKGLEEKLENIQKIEVSQ